MTLGMLQCPSEDRPREGKGQGSCFSSEGRDLHLIFQALSASVQRHFTVAQTDFHFVSFGEHLADLQESLVLRLRDDQPDVDQRNQTYEGKDEKTVGAQAFLKNAEERKCDQHAFPDSMGLMCWPQIGCKRSSA